MKVWVVNADDHDYDYMSQWHVGVFSSPAKADAAAKADRKAYKGHAKKHGGPNYEIIETKIDEIMPNE